VSVSTAFSSGIITSRKPRSAKQSVGRKPLVAPWRAQRRLVRARKSRARHIQGKAKIISFFNRFRSTFSVDGANTKYNFKSFWKWSYYNVDTPLLRGVLIEYLVVSTLLDHSARVVSKRISDLTHDTATQKALRKSLSPFYSYQPHGDLFDLQLHWGVTIEVKSTENLETGRLHKTHWWGPINKRDNGPKLFISSPILHTRRARESRGFRK
jgi:hypothetical protein